MSFDIFMVSAEADVCRRSLRLEHNFFGGGGVGGQRAASSPTMKTVSQLLPLPFAHSIEACTKFRLSPRGRDVRSLASSIPDDVISEAEVEVWSVSEE